MITPFDSVVGQAKLNADLIASKNRAIAQLTKENARLRANQCQCAAPSKVKQGFIQENGTLRSYKYVEVE